MCSESWKAALESCKREFNLPEKAKIREFREEIELTGFSDSDWAGNMGNRVSTSGYCFKLINSSGAISWASKLRKSVSTSTVEAELSAVVGAAIEEVVHLAILLHEVIRKLQ